MKNKNKTIYIVILTMIVIVEGILLLFLFVITEDSKEWFREEITSPSITIVGHETSPKHIFGNNRNVSISVYDNSSRPRRYYSFSTLLQSDKQQLDSDNYKIEQHSDYFRIILINDNGEEVFIYRYDY